METPDRAYQLEQIGSFVLRYSLVVTFLWFGLLKFVEYEAMAIEPLVSKSPIFSGLLAAIGLKNLSALIGVIEISIGLLIAARAFAPMASAIGSIGAAITFLITSSFILTTPGVWQPGYGFPYPAPMPGGFLLKDLVLLGASVWTAGEALRAARREQALHATPPMSSVVHR